MFSRVIVRVQSSSYNSSSRLYYLTMVLAMYDLLTFIMCVKLNGDDDNINKTLYSAPYKAKVVLLRLTTSE